MEVLEASREGNKLIKNFMLDKGDRIYIANLDGSIRVFGPPGPVTITFEYQESDMNADDP